MVEQFQYILDHFHEMGQYTDKNNKNFKILTIELPNLIKNFLKRDDYYVYGSSGTTKTSFCPWVAITNKAITKTTQTGIYLVYLFRKDMKGFYLSLNQGITKFGKDYKSDKYKNFECVVAEFQKRINTNTFVKDPIYLGVDEKNTRGYDYAKANIISKYYPSNNFTYNELKKDLIEMSKIYDEIYGTFGNFTYENVVKTIIFNSTGIPALIKAEEASEKLKKAIDPYNETPFSFKRKLKEVNPKIRNKRQYLTNIEAMPTKIDYLARAATNEKNGLTGEMFALEYEKNRLVSMGYPELAKKVEWVSDKNDALGYDIISVNVDENGKEKKIYIEVKTTSLSNDSDFFVSYNEVKKSKEFGENYCIFRIYDVNSETPKMYKVFGEIEKHFEINPYTFLAFYKG